MKKSPALRCLLTPLLTALAISASHLTIRAADANPPARMTYQGFVVDSNGTPLGNVNVQNFDIVFRIYTASQGGNIVWSEQQTVTIDKGNFAVLLGEGTAVAGEPRPTLDAIFASDTASDRFIGITVKGLAGGESEIAPRLRLMTSPYAFLAKNATTLVGPNGQALMTVVNGAIQSTGGNARGANAVDLQVVRNEAFQVASGATSAVGGGQNNIASGANSVIGGGFLNTASALNALVSGGAENIASGVTATISGGFKNVNNGHESTIGGGGFNTTAAFRSTVGGGGPNTATADFATVAGGNGNKATGIESFAGGGINNTASGLHSAIAGGNLNTASAIDSHVGGGFRNTASGDTATVGGGSDNRATGSKSTIGGGINNLSSGVNSTVAGGVNNTNIGVTATISGGFQNVNSGTDAAIGGGNGNTVTAFAATIAGGQQNRATGVQAAVAGGHLNKATGVNAFVGAGYQNESTSTESTVGGGLANFATALRATVAGGVDNQSTGDHATIGGGHLNRAAGINSAVPGGYNNRAQGNHSFAAGRRAKANHDGSFVWADDQDADFATTSAREFIVRAEGGVGINTADPAVPLHVRAGASDLVGPSHEVLRLESPLHGYWDLEIDNQAGDADLIFYKNTVEIGWIDPSGGGFRTPSDRRLKKDIKPIEPGVLGRVARIPVVNFRLERDADDAPLQLGVIAQDVQAVYPEIVEDHNGRLGVSYDRVGVIALAAIQELKTEKDAEIAKLKEENAALKTRTDQQISDLKGEMAALKKMIAALAGKDNAVAASK